MICKTILLKMLFFPYKLMKITDFRFIIIFAHYPIGYFKMLDILKDIIQMVINFELKL